MSMRAQMKKEGEFTVVTLDGNTEYQNSRELSDKLKNLYGEHGVDRILIDMANLDFVGSSGIRNFIETLKAINTAQKKKTRLCGVKSEFRRIFEVMARGEFEMFETREEAMLIMEEIAKTAKMPRST